MRKTAIELTEEQYFFPHKRALKLQKQIQNASVMSIIRDLVGKDRQEWVGTKKKGEGKRLCENFRSKRLSGL